MKEGVSWLLLDKFMKFEKSLEEEKHTFTEKELDDMKKINEMYKTNFIDKNQTILHYLACFDEYNELLNKLFNLDGIGDLYYYDVAKKTPLDWAKYLYCEKNIETLKKYDDKFNNVMYILLN